MKYNIFNDIVCYKNTEIIIQDNTNINSKEKAILVSKETGIPIKFIYDDSSSFIYDGIVYCYDKTDNWFKNKENWYYVKTPYNGFNLFNELLGEQITLYFGLRSAEYSIINFQTENKNTYKIASKNFFVQNHEYFTHDNINISKDYTNLKRILNDIKNICYSNNDNNLSLLNDIISMSIRDLYEGNMDRHRLNFFYEKNQDIIRLAPLFDYEDSSFNYGDLSYSNAIWHFDLNDTNFSNILLKEDLFKQAILKLLDLDIKHLLSLTQEIHNIEISKELLKYYLKKDKHIKGLIKKLNL